MSTYSQKTTANTCNTMQFVPMHQVNTVSDPGGAYSVKCLWLIKLNQTEL